MTMNRRNFLALGTTIFTPFIFADSNNNLQRISKKWYLPSSLAGSPNNLILSVRDTDSALGRYNLPGYTKSITLDELVKYHGHSCDGIVFSFLQLSVALRELFKDGVIDRTDLRGACKNSPCMVDALSYMTGARINFKTLRIDQSLGISHIVQKISTGETYQVVLADGIFDENFKRTETYIRSKISAGKPVLPSEIDTFESMSTGFIEKILSMPLEKLISIKRLSYYAFEPNSSIEAFGNRSDIANKNVSR